MKFRITVTISFLDKIIFDFTFKLVLNYFFLIFLDKPFKCKTITSETFKYELELSKNKYLGHYDTFFR